MTDKNFNDEILEEFRTRMKTTGQPQMVEFAGKQVQFGDDRDQILAAADAVGATKAFNSEQNHSTVSAANGIDKNHNPKDGQPC